MWNLKSHFFINLYGLERNELSLVCLYAFICLILTAEHFPF